MRSSGCVSCRIFACKTHSTPSTQSTSSQQCAEMRQHREAILKTLLESEQDYVAALEDLMGRTIQPLIVVLSISSPPCFHLNFHRLEELIKFHRHFSFVLRDSIHDRNEHRIGELFLRFAPILKPIFDAYCSQHGRLLSLFKEHRDRIVKALSKLERSRDANIIYNQLIRNLSLPLNRVEKYACVLREYLHHLEEFHSDRGSAQRAWEYYAELARAGNEWRKDREWKLEVVRSPIPGLTTETLQSFGEALCLSPVHVLCESSHHQMLLERTALLYSTTLFLLSKSSTEQNYRIENGFPLNQITVTKVLREHHFSKHVLQIDLLSSHQSWIIFFPSSVEYYEWCEKFSILLPVQSSHPSLKSATMYSSAVTSQLSVISSRNVPTRLSPRSPVVGANSTWSKSCLRPHSPLRLRQTTAVNGYSSTPGSPNLAASVDEGGSTPNRTLKRFMTMKKSKATELFKRVETSEGDALLLSVIEAYCITSAHSTAAGGVAHFSTLIAQTGHSFQAPPDQTNIPMAPLQTTSSTNYLDADERQAMYDILSELQARFKVLQRELEEEKQARKQFECQIQGFLLSNVEP